MVMHAASYKYSLKKKKKEKKNKKNRREKNTQFSELECKKKVIKSKRETQGIA